MITATASLTDFLLARIAEDEAAVARPPEVRSMGFYGASLVPVGGHDWGHVAYLSPARVLAECEAKRRIVGLHFAVTPYSVCGECGEPDAYPAPWPCSTLRALAAVYSAHPDCREEWRP